MYILSRRGLCSSFKLYSFSFKQIVEASGPLGKGQKRKASQLSKTITIGSSPILYTQPTASAGENPHDVTTMCAVQHMGRAVLICKNNMITHAWNKSSPKLANSRLLLTSPVTLVTLHYSTALKQINSTLLECVCVCIMGLQPSNFTVRRDMTADIVIGPVCHLR